jgi:hypothetical protein
MSHDLHLRAPQGVAVEELEQQIRELVGDEHANFTVEVVREDEIAVRLLGPPSDVLRRLLEELERRHGFRPYGEEVDVEKVRQELKEVAARQAECDERMATLTVMRSSLLKDADEGPDGDRAMARALEVEQELDKLRALAVELRAQAHELRLLLLET